MGFWKTEGAAKIIHMRNLKKVSQTCRNRMSSWARLAQEALATFTLLIKQAVMFSLEDEG